MLLETRKIGQKLGLQPRRISLLVWIQNGKSVCCVAEISHRSRIEIRG